MENHYPNQPVIGKFIDPLLDFSFKWIFGTEPNKDLLIALLNGIFQRRKEIVELVYNKNEHTGDTEEIGGVIFDLTCTAGNGEKFIIEVQRSALSNLKRRMLYYIRFVPIPSPYLVYGIHAQQEYLNPGQRLLRLRQSLCAIG